MHAICKTIICDDLEDANTEEGNTAWHYPVASFSLFLKWVSFL